MNDGNMFTVSACNSIDSGKLADAYPYVRPVQGQKSITKCRDERTQSFDTSITICRICSIKFVAFN